MSLCSQCGKPAVATLGGQSLCVEHYHQYTETLYMAQQMNAAMFNLLSDQIAQGSGGLAGGGHVLLPPLPSRSGGFVLNNINVSGSTVNSINTGSIQRLDASISMLRAQGQDEMASAVLELAQGLVDNAELQEQHRNEIAEMLEFLTSQVISQQPCSSVGLARAALGRVRELCSTVTSALAVWDKLEPLLRSAIGL